ncbi:MAG: AAA family ATPase [Campylobacter sp.]|nr:AAA family ATPase [Campylobacter sp.]
MKEHNDIIDTLAHKKEDLKNKIWCYLIKENETFIAQYNKNKQDCDNAISSLSSKINECTSKISTLNEELKNLNKKDVSTKAAVDNINDILRNYGFMNFQIVSAKDENTYTLQRQNGSFIKDDLSEGEVTFITFLYYMQLVHGSLNDDGIQKEKVLVIDDPISSLDSNILFIVSSLIKEELKKLGDANNKIKQIIILTHNIYFYKEISFIDGRENTRNDLSYWIIRKEERTSSIQKYDKNPISSSYDLYWREIREHENEGKCNIYTQNIMRRIIEHYFKILGKYNDMALLDKFENPNEKIIARSLISWINDGSHSLPDDLFIEEPEQSTKNYFEIFKKIFEKTDQKSHYEMMMGVQN